MKGHRVGYARVIVKRPPSDSGAGHFTAFLQSKGNMWSCHPKQRAAGATEGQGAPHWSGGQEGHFGRLNTTGRECSKERSSWVNSPERAELLSSASKLSMPREGWQYVCFCRIQGNRLCVNSFQLGTGCTNICDCLYSLFPS